MLAVSRARCMLPSMSVRDAHGLGTFCWVDLTAFDIDMAESWYRELLGWSFDADGTSQGGGWFSSEGESVAGVRKASDAMLRDKATPVWLSFVCVDDLDAMTVKATVLGGRVESAPEAVGERGRMAIISDPQGAQLGLWQPGTHAGAQRQGQPGSVCWNELNTPDLAASRRFYGELFGWELVSDGGSPEYVEVRQGEHGGAGMIASEGRSAHWMVYFAVDDVEARTQAVASSRGGVILPSRTIPGVGTFSVVSDPRGAVFALIELESRP